MKKIFYYALLICGAMFISCQSGEEMVDYFSDNAFANPIIGNAGECYNGVTYVAYQGEETDPYVAAYNHNSKEWSGPYKVGVSLLGKTAKNRTDSHGKPTLVIDGDGYIHVAFGGHGGSPDIGANTLGNYNTGRQIHVKSKKPLDITEWEVVDNISPFGTYCQFFKMSNGDIYLFYRHGAHRSNLVYQLSTDNCKTFSDPVSYLKVYQLPDMEGYVSHSDSWYLNMEYGEGDDLLFAYHYHHCKNREGTGHEGERFNCYYMRFDTAKNEWYNVEGEKLQIPLDKSDADAKTLVYNTGERVNYIGRVGLIQSNGYPFVTWYESDSGSSAKRLCYYQWNGAEWIGAESNLPIGVRGEIVAESSEVIHCLSGSTEKGVGNVAWWSSCDGGREFTKEKEIMSHEGRTFDLSHIIRNSHPDARFVATQRIEGSEYSRVYLAGDNGVIERAKSAASVLSVEE